MKNCKEVARLISESKDRRLSLFDRLEVRLHLVMCVMCRRFSKQIAFLHRLTGRMGGAESVDAFDRSLSPEARSRIETKLREMF